MKILFVITLLISICFLFTGEAATVEKREAATVGIKCKPGTSWEQDCNSCFCSPDRNEMCSLVECLN